jgi:hypothetical protein
LRIWFSNLGIFAISSKEIQAIYVVMAVLGLVCSMKHSIEWNFSILMASVAVGGYMELIGSLSGFWQYHFQEPLALYIVLSWPINTWAVHGLIYLAGIDMGAYKERCLFRSANSDTLIK